MAGTNCMFEQRPLKRIIFIKHVQSVFVLECCHVTECNNYIPSKWGIKTDMGLHGVALTPVEKKAIWLDTLFHTVIISVFYNDESKRKFHLRQDESW